MAGKNIFLELSVIPRLRAITVPSHSQHILNNLSRQQENVSLESFSLDTPVVPREGTLREQLSGYTSRSKRREARRVPLWVYQSSYEKGRSEKNSPGIPVVPREGRLRFEAYATEQKFFLGLSVVPREE